MKLVRSFFQRLMGYRGREAREREFQAELDAHFQMHVEDNLRAGMDAAEARRQAALRFGSVESAREAVRERWTLAFVDQLRRDTLYALRGLKRNPGFAAAAILSLGLGAGAAIAIFTVADSLLLRPLPYHDPGRLVMVWEHSTRPGRPLRNVIAPGNYFDWKKQSRSFESIAAFADGRAVLDDRGLADEVGIQYVTQELLPMTGVKPVRGRLFTPEEDLPDSPIVVILSHRLWQSRFAGSDDVVGRKLTVGGRPATVIGILPAGFYFRNRETDLWAALGLDPNRDYRRNSGRYLTCAARLKPDISVAAGQAEMTAIAARLEQEYPAFDRYWTVYIEPLRDSMIFQVKTSMYVLLGAVGLLLAVACANVANLLLARYTTRRRELSVRTAIGAGQGRVVRQLLTESLVLGAAGGVLGLGIARAGVAALVALAPRDLARNADITMDLRIVAFAIGLSLLTGLLFGLAPALTAIRGDVLGGLREGARGSTGSHRLRNVLVALEVALSIVLLAGAGLLFRTLIGLQSVQSGLDPSSVLTLRVTLPNGRYRDAVQRKQFFERALSRMRELPGVRSASAINSLPFFGFASATRVDIAGHPTPPQGQEPSSVIRTVMPGYFTAMRIPIRKGRDFDEHDNDPEVPYRFLINEAFARQFMSGEEPLGRMLSARMQDKNPFGEIIGVVGDLKEGSVDKDAVPTIYYNQGHMTSGNMYFVLRTAISPLQLAAAAQGVIHDLDSSQPVADVASMETVVSETFARQRFSAVLLIGFSVIAVALAAIGIYGVLAYSVAERTREFGIRMALGADARRVIGLVAVSGARVVAIGAIAGLTGAYLLTGLLQSLLFGVTPHDPVTFVAVPCVLCAVAMIAAYLPARRASRVAPAEALRAE